MTPEMHDPNAPINPRVTIGSNQPPPDLAITPEDVVEARAAKYAQQAAQVEELLARATKIASCDDDDTLELVINVISAMRTSYNEMDGARKIENKPYDALIDASNGWFYGYTGRLKTEGDRLKALQTRRLQILDAERRAREKAEAAAAAEEAARIKAEADARKRFAETEEEKQEAEAQHQVAANLATGAQEMATKAQVGKSADYSRTRTSMGKMATLVETVKFTVRRRDLDWGKLAQFLSEDAITAAIDNYKRIHKKEIEAACRDPDRTYDDLPGVDFYISTSSSNRR